MKVQIVKYDPILAKYANIYLWTIREVQEVKHTNKGARYYVYGKSGYGNDKGKNILTMVYDFECVQIK